MFVILNAFFCYPDPEQREGEGSQILPFDSRSG